MDEIIKKLKEGIKLSAINSDNLFNSAELLAANNFFSPAIPLLILSAEEIIKSFALSLEFFVGGTSEVKQIIEKSKNKAADSHLFNHEDKHKLAQRLIKDLQKISPFFNLARIFVSKKYKKHIDFFCLSNEQYKEIDKLMVDFEKFNRLKNQGLYVDNINDKWETPLSFSLSDFESCKKNVLLIRDVFSTRIKYFLDIPEGDLSLLVDALKMNQVT